VCLGVPLPFRYIQFSIQEHLYFNLALKSRKRSFALLFASNYLNDAFHNHFIAIYSHFTLFSVWFFLLRNFSWNIWGWEYIVETFWAKKEQFRCLSVCSWNMDTPSNVVTQPELCRSPLNYIPLIQHAKKSVPFVVGTMTIELHYLERPLAQWPYSNN